MADKNTYLDNVPIDGFYEIIPKRRAVIEAASDEFPKYDYNANVLYRYFHPEVQHVIVTDVKEMKDAKVFTLAPDTAAGTKELALFRAGQYISVNLTIGKSVLTRPYSLCGSPAESLAGTYSIVVKSMKDGFASEYINKNWEKGTKVDISEPAGFFTYEPLRDQKAIVGIAGGSGIAPFISFAKAIADGNADFDREGLSFVLLYGSKKEDEILFREELDELCARCEKIKVVHVLSDEQKEGFENGFITADIIKKYAPEDGEYSVFVCGSQGMYDFILGETEKLGLRKKLVRFDAYGEYKLGDRDEAVKDTKDKTFTIKVTTKDGVTRSIPAKGSETVLTAFERAGIKAPSRCRSGECGFCRSRLVSGTVYMPEKTERRRGYDRENDYIHPCCAFPTSDCVIYIDYEAPELKRSVKDMRKKNRTMGITMAILMSAAMGAIATYLVRGSTPQAAEMPAPLMYAENIVLSVVLGLLFALILPFGKWGRALANKAKAGNGSFKFNLLNAIPLSIGNTVLISLALSAFGVFSARSHATAESLAHMPPFAVMWLGQWAKLLLPTLLASYIFSVLLSPLVSDIVGLPAAGAEVGRAAKKDVSVEAVKKARAKAEQKKAEQAKTE